jgi:hypothetical protein
VGIRAAVCHDVHSAHQCVEHDDVNVMYIGAQIVGPWLAKDLVAPYLDAKFSTDEEFRRRMAKLAEMDAGRQEGFFCSCPAIRSGHADYSTVRLFPSICMIRARRPLISRAIKVEALSASANVPGASSQHNDWGS